MTPKGLEELPQPCFPVISEFASRGRLVVSGSSWLTGTVRFCRVLTLQTVEGLQMVSCQLKQDAPVTVPTHPLKKFAEAFLHCRLILVDRRKQGKRYCHEATYLHGQAAHLCTCYLVRIVNLQP